MSYYKVVQVGLTPELLAAVQEKAKERKQQPTKYIRALICDDLGMPNPDTGGDEKWAALEEETA